MADWFEGAAVLAAALWTLVLLLPWQPWRNREVLEPGAGETADHRDLTVLIPARNEADVIGRTLEALAVQAPGLKVVLVDDGSDDGTAEVARQVDGLRLTVVAGEALPPGWSGKLWALEQGLRYVETAQVLLLDADIELKPGMLAVLLAKQAEGWDFVSIMAWLRTRSWWEKLLMPAFVYFFKFIYPFALANSPRISWVAAGAGGCILVRTEALRRCGAFASLREALIDDCTLATRVKALGYRTWIGLSHGVVSHRAYDDLETIWNMVARTAYTQLRYSPWLLAVCTLLMGEMFLVPVAAIAMPPARLWGLSAWILMALTYLPTVRFYRLSPAWAPALPAVASLYLAMTWSSAWRYWHGVRSAWKGRVYG